MLYVFPIINSALENGVVSVKSIATLLDNDEFIILDKLCGNNSFDINEAMTINNELFPDVPFKRLFATEYDF